jgi:hypothetical protein
MKRLDKASLVDAQEISFDFEERTKRLELIADKAVELRLMIEAALNPLDMNPDIDWLKAEVECFKLACRGART